MSSRTRGPTMTRARAAFALAKAARTSPSPCPITSGFALAASAAARNPACTASAARLNDADASGSTSTMGPVRGVDVRVRHAIPLSGRRLDTACRRRLRLPPEFARRTMRAMRTRRRSRTTTSRQRVPTARVLEAAGGDHTSGVEFRMDEERGGGKCGRTRRAFSRCREHYMWLPHRSEICAT